MTYTAKPTPGPWAINTGGQIYSKHPSYDTQTIAKIDISCLPTRAVRNYGDADLICEAGTVFHETNLTPRQLLERVRELEAALAGAEKELSVWHESAERGELAWYDAQERGDLPFFGLKKIRAALTKHGEESQ